MFITDSEDGAPIMLGRIILAGICSLVSVGVIGSLTQMHWGLLVVLFFVLTFVVFCVLAMFGAQPRGLGSDEYEDYEHEGLTD